MSNEKLQQQIENIVVVEEFPDERYYDLSICYDDYYYTPRLFLTGVDESN